VLRQFESVASGCGRLLCCSSNTSTCFKNTEGKKCGNDIDVTCWYLSMAFALIEQHPLAHIRLCCIDIIENQHMVFTRITIGAQDSCHHLLLPF
jgi:hypothetical protein